MLIRPLLLACGIVLTIGTFLSVFFVKTEYEELLDINLVTKAQLLLPLMTLNHDHQAEISEDQMFQMEGVKLDDDERPVFWLVDADQMVLRQSNLIPTGLDQSRVTQPGLSTFGNYRWYVTGPNASGYRLKIGDPLVERNETILGSIVGVSLSMIVLVLIAFIIIRRSIARVQRSIIGLSADIGQRNETNLSPIDNDTAFIEMAPTITTLNALMARLAKVVEAERNFSTNAAHELRTPLAVSLAHTQRLKAETDDPALSKRATEIEAGLKKLLHLVERLLQFSRAQSGLGKSNETRDANQVIALLFDEAIHRRYQTAHIQALYPDAAFLSPIDPDALAIMLSNLIDNAVKYSSGQLPVELDAHQPGIVTISNDCDALSATDIVQVKSQFVRRSSITDGYGVGLSIVNMLCEQSGVRMEIISPRANSDRGVSVRLNLPAE